MNFRQKNLRVFHQHLLVQRALISIIVLNRLAELFRLTQIQAPSPIPLNKGGEGVVEDEQEKKVEYSYDKNGNLTKKIEYDDDGNIKTITLYTYDYENRPIRVEMQRNGREKIVEFTYDPFGRRLSKSVHKEEIDDEDNDKDDDDKVTPRTTYYVYDNEDIILEQLQTPNSKLKTIRYVHGLGIDEPLSIERKGKIYYYHADGLGSVTSLTDSKGKVAQRYDYDSFGNLKRKGDKVKNTYAFTGREWDKETGLYYYRARYYDPKVGRFISKDPIGFFGGVNLYTYVGNNPMYWIDPWGLVTWPGTGIVTSPFGNRIDPITNAQSFHNGVDIGNPLGGAVVASDSGNVISITSSPNGANQIIIRNDDGSISGYAHNNPSVQVGQHVNEGDVIGKTDLSGRSTGGHVHYTYRPSAGQPYQNPLNHLPTQNNYPGGRCR